MSVVGTVLLAGTLGAAVVALLYVDVRMRKEGLDVELARAAHALGVEVVVTHLFDGPIALRASGVLALIVQSGALAAGLAPHAGLDAWPLWPVDADPKSATELLAQSFGNGVIPAELRALRGGAL